MKGVQKAKSQMWRSTASQGNCEHLPVPGVQGYMGKMKDGAGKLKMGLVMKSLDTCRFKEIVF